MKYVGIQTQIRRNNLYSVLLLLLFPVIILVMVWVFLALLNFFGNGYYDQYGEFVNTLSIEEVNRNFISTIPWVIIGVSIWFVIAYFANTSMVRNAVGARPLTRKENPRIYNIVENLCMTCNMDMPQINVVDDPQLNAFASGIDKKSYTVTVTTGLADRLNDEELAGVIGHELTHIRVRKLLSIIVILVIGIVCSFIAYIFTLITRFAISRRREYMADAGGAELCGNPMALASALRKISANPGLGGTNREDVAQLFIIRPAFAAKDVMSFISSLFSTHPDTQKRIEVLEQF